jgi:hypothetical protein
MRERLSTRSVLSWVTDSEASHGSRMMREFWDMTGVSVGIFAGVVPKSR